MKTDYKFEINLTRREMLGICGIVGGGAIAMGGSSVYEVSLWPSKPEILKRYDGIERELKSTELIARVKELRAERDEITSDPGFAKAREIYASEVSEGRHNYFLLGGVAIILSSLGLAIFLKGNTTK